MVSASGHQTPKSQQGMWSLAVCHDEGTKESSYVGAAPIYGTYSSSTPPAFNLAAGREGVTFTQTCPARGARCCSQHDQVCRPPDDCKEDGHKGASRESTSAGCRWGGYGDRVFALTSVSCNHHIASHHDLWTQVRAPIRTMPLLAMVGYLLLI